MILPDKYYKIIKWGVLTVLPASSVLVATLGKAYGWQQTDMAVLTINAIATFLGVVTGVAMHMINSLLPRLVATMLAVFMNNTHIKRKWQVLLHKVNVRIPIFGMTLGETWTLRKQRWIISCHVFKRLKIPSLL